MNWSQIVIPILVALGTAVVTALKDVLSKSTETQIKELLELREQLRAQKLAAPADAAVGKPYAIGNALKEIDEQLDSLVKRMTKERENQNKNLSAILNATKCPLIVMGIAAVFYVLSVDLTWVNVLSVDLTWVNVLSVVLTWVNALSVVVMVIGLIWFALKA